MMIGLFMLEYTQFDECDAEFVLDYCAVFIMANL